MSVLFLFLQKGNNAMKRPASNKTVFDMKPEEFKKLIRPAADRVLEETWAKDGFITYYDEKICPDMETLIQEFKDHSELVRIDDQGKATVIKQLTDERTPGKTTGNRSRAERSR
jgi:hypothetical protein